MTTEQVTTPVSLTDALNRTARRMATSFHRLGSLNGKRNAPMPERNTVVHLAATLIELEFGVYAEASFDESGNGDAGARRGRIDLIASNGQETFVFELKTFGRRRFDLVLEDARRVAAYRPQAEDRTDGQSRTGFWDDSKRWGCVVVQSFTSDAINDLWRKQIDQPEAFAAEIEQPIDGLPESEKPGFLQLNEFLRSRRAVADAVLVCNRSGELWNCLPLHLLWAAFEIE